MISRKGKVFLLLGCAAVAGVLLLGPAVLAHLRAFSILLRFSNPRDSELATAFARGPFSEELGSAPTSAGSLRYRIYRPTTSGLHPGIVLLHGVHHLGIDEPRLTAFSKALAGAGMTVLTPELEDLADFRVTRKTVEEIGLSAGILCKLTGQPKAGILGLSFAGGLALLAAADPAYAPRIAFVVAIGAHDDLSRVARFFATNQVEEPDGSITAFKAHEYGVLVLVYAHIENYFSPADLPAAREALRLWLWEQPGDALQAAQRLSPAGQARFDVLIHHREQIRDNLLREIAAHKAEMLEVSPHGHLGSLAVPVFLLHGAGDTVIPAAETRWLAREIPHKELRAVLISPALIHVNVESGVSLREKWDLMNFLAQVIELAGKAEKPAAG